MKLLPTFIIAFAVYCYAPTSYDMALQDAQDRAYVYMLANYRNDDRISRMYADAVIRYSNKYYLDSRLIARQIFRESFYNNSLRHKSGALGACQIKRCHDAIIKQTESYNSDVGVEENYFYIYPSVEALCILMKNAVEKYRDYDDALMAYWCGEYSAEFKSWEKKDFDFYNTEYYKAIMVDGYIERYLMGLK